MFCIIHILGANEPTRLKDCKSTKEIWDKLQEINKGSDNIKEQKKSLLVTNMNNDGTT